MSNHGPREDTSIEKERQLRAEIAKIIEILPKLPEKNIAVPTSKGVRKIQTRKRVFYSGGQHFEGGGGKDRVTQPANEVEIEIRDQSDHLIMIITYKDQYTHVINEQPRGERHPGGLNPKKEPQHFSVAIPEKFLFDVHGEEITTCADGLTGEDLKKITDLLNLALAEHQKQSQDAIERATASTHAKFEELM